MTEQVAWAACTAVFFICCAFVIVKRGWPDWWKDES